jgi:hypothetical protein
MVNEAVLFYDIEIKPHFTQDWYGSGKGWFRADTTSQYTTVSFPRCNFPSEGQVDFRAQLYSGYYYDYIDHSHIQDIPQRTFS